ncbi:hypothetical protein J7T55_007191 [Diaporthe amygdali]|uniref:uncharacterized protein n=1 Tax=Phomopsis amygdali TaxID=1214568 RepID=UPI0022FDDE9E|nr:uncharacterized protein J7T55_007191 [Diaporthe amygdali]KAJ0108072.1 hypothetical protein J7T55_007191 [Diaporthe amygdali]
MRSCVRLQSSLSLAGFKLCRPAAHFYSTNGADIDVVPKSQKHKTRRETRRTTSKEPRGKRLEQEQDDLGFDQWSWSEVNVIDKTIETAAGKLPISPLVDSTWREARQRRKTKARPDKATHNRFQRQLRQNPYAQLLATPVRFCAVTRTQLPKGMLQSFGLVRHPETNHVWWIPEGLDAGRRRAKEESNDAEEADVPSSTATKDDPEDGATLATDGISAGVDKKQSKYNYPTHALARQDLLQNFIKMGNKYYGAHHRLAGAPHAPVLARSASWRADMDVVILDQRRRSIMEDLLYLSTLCEEHGRKYIIKVTGAKYAATYVHRAAFLWLGEDKALNSEDGTSEPGAEAEKAEVDPEQYATLDINGDPTTTRPVYNLPRLLGPANVARLRSESSILQEGPLFLLRSQRSGDLNKKLWSLQGYMADHTKL